MRDGDHRPGLVDQGLGGAPVLAADGQDGPLGQSDGGGDGRPGVWAISTASSCSHTSQARTY
jgi:hypothetical protein